MVTQTTYTQARAKLAALCDQVIANREVVIIRRRGAEDVALISVAELSSLMETAHLLRSPKNAERLLTALARAQREMLTPQSVEELRREVGLDEAAYHTGWRPCSARGSVSSRVSGGFAVLERLHRY